MAVYAPGDDPSDVSSGGFPSWIANLPASIQAQLMRIGNYANPVSSANAAPASIAASVSQPPNPLTNPTPVDPRLTGGGPPIDADTLARINGSITGGGGSSGGGGASGGAWPVGPPGSQPAPAAPPVMGPPQNPTPWFPSSNTPYAPNPAAGAPTPPIRPAVARGGGRINPNARAQAPGAAGNPFTMINRPNMGPGPMYDQRGNPISPSGGALAARRGPSGGPPLMTALDLSKLFGRS